MVKEDVSSGTLFNNNKKASTWNQNRVLLWEQPYNPYGTLFSKSVVK
jgi:hypothetical protein